MNEIITENGTVLHLEDKDDVYEYLNKLRESGVTNMFGATPYLQNYFGFTKGYARAWLGQWMGDFGNE
jgi:uncharacterized glyoxalase superfamily protein PhnB